MATAKANAGRFLNSKDRGPGTIIRLSLAGALSVFALGLCLVTVNRASAADDPNPAADDGGLAEIIVTASKARETLQKAPIAISVLSQATLDSSGIVELSNLTSVAPNVEVKTVSLGNSVQVAIRGISNSDFNELGNPAVATYVDGLYVGRTTGLNGGLYDLERIEVLRGPQGTLYGRNSTGGNLNVSTADPKPTFGASGDVAYGKFNDVQTRGMVNIPITDTFSLRAAFETHRNDGYVNTQGTTARNYQAADDFSGRLTALWTPSEAFKWRLAVENFVSNGTPGLDYSTGPDGRPNDHDAIYNRPVPSNPEPSDHLDNLMIRSRMDWQLVDGLSLTYIAGYQSIRERVIFALSDNTFNGIRPDQTESYQSELDLNFQNSFVRNILGATYYHQSVASENSYYLNAAGLTFTSCCIVVPSHAQGVFDQATFNATDSLRVIAGVRYSSEDQSLNTVTEKFCPITLYPNIPLSQLAGFFGAGCFGVPYAGGRGHWANVSWKGGLEYDLTSTTTGYLTATSGFKSGGVNQGVGASDVPGTFKPETLVSYELGIKSQFFDHRVNLNTALFNSNYKNLQVDQIAGGSTPVTITENAAKAKIYGLEVEGQWRVTPVDHLNAFANYLHATYTDYSGAVDALTGAVVPSLAGHYLPNAPKYSTRLDYSHDFSLPSGGTLTPLIASYYQARTYLREFNDPIDTVGGYSKSSANLTYADQSGHWKLSAFAENLENRAIRLNGAVAVGAYFSDYDLPRTYGFRAAYTY